jgi:hypothetical protein
MVRKGGFELLHHVDNTQLIDFAFGLKAQVPHNLASIVRLLYGERTAEEKTAPKRFLSILPTNSLASALPIGQGHLSRMSGMVLRRAFFFASPNKRVPSEIFPWDIASQAASSSASYSSGLPCAHFISFAIPISSFNANAVKKQRRWKLMSSKVPCTGLSQVILTALTFVGTYISAEP